jgi:hypothetical protein
MLKIAFFLSFSQSETNLLFPLTKKEQQMAILNNLKLVASKRTLSASPVVHRRNKLVKKIHEQIELCEAQKAGQTYAPKRLKTYMNKQTGERMTVETIKRVKEWFWIGDTGKINLAVKYGSKTLPLNKKGANAIECTNGDELIATLKSLKIATLDGELDDAITEISAATKARFVK